MIFNILFKRLFNKVTFTKVIIIFVVGLFSRVLINYFYGVNVFVDYTNLISLYYYGFMSLFIVFINEVVVYFEWDIFALLGNFIRSLFGFVKYFIYIVFSFFSYIFHFHYFTLGNIPPSFDGKDINDKGIFTVKRNGDDVSDEERRDRRIRRWLRRGDPSSAALGGLYPGSEIRRPVPAGIRGLYHPNSRSTNIDSSEFNTSFLQKIKCRVYWYSFGQFGSNYSNYYDFKNSLDHNISIRQTVKKILK